MAYSSSAAQMTTIGVVVAGIAGCSLLLVLPWISMDAFNRLRGIVVECPR